MAPRVPSAWEKSSPSSVSSSSYFNRPSSFATDKTSFYDKPYSSPNSSSYGTWNRDTDWGGSGRGIDWKSGFNVDKGGLYENTFGKKKWYENPDMWNTVKEGLFDIARSKRDGNFGGYSGPLGYPLPGTGGNLLENLSVYESPKQPPFVIEGTPGKKGLGGAIGGLLGIGASFIPGLGPGIAAAMPAIGGGVGGLFD